MTRSGMRRSKIMRGYGRKETLIQRTKSGDHFRESSGR